MEENPHAFACLDFSFTFSCAVWRRHKQHSARRDKNAERAAAVVETERVHVARGGDVLVARGGDVADLVAVIR